MAGGTRACNAGWRRPCYARAFRPRRPRPGWTVPQRGRAKADSGTAGHRSCVLNVAEPLNDAVVRVGDSEWKTLSHNELSDT
jgi:hypothetical protein